MRTRQSVMDEINTTGTFSVQGHDAGCVDLVMEDMHRNAFDAGVWGSDYLAPWDTVWGTLAADLVDQWLTDGTASCRCREAAPAVEAAPVEADIPTGQVRRFTSNRFGHVAIRRATGVGTVETSAASRADYTATRTRTVVHFETIGQAAPVGTGYMPIEEWRQGSTGTASQPDQSRCWHCREAATHVISRDGQPKPWTYCQHHAQAEAEMLGGTVAPLA